MKLKNTVLTAAIFIGFSLSIPVSAQPSQYGFVGNLSQVNGPVFINRGGQMLRAVENSAVMKADVIVAQANGGSAVINVAGQSGGFPSCNQIIRPGSMVALRSNNHCADLALVMPVSPNQVVLSSNYSQGGTAFPKGILLAGSGAGLGGLGLASAAGGSSEPLGQRDRPVTP